MSKTIKLKRFKGINNIINNLEGGLKWFNSAENIDINNNGSISTRKGYIKKIDSNNIKFIFGNKKETKLYYIENNNIYLFDKNGSIELFNGLTGTNYSYSEYNDSIYLSDGKELYIIKENNFIKKISFNKPNQVNLSKNSSNSKLFKGVYKVVITHTIILDGVEIETGSSDESIIEIEDGDSIVISDIEQIIGQKTSIYIAPANSTVYQFYKDTILSITNFSDSINILGRELNSLNLESIPFNVDKIDFLNNKLFISIYSITENITQIYYSNPYAVHLFNLEKDFIQIKGRITLLKTINNKENQFLLLSTDDNIYIYNEDSITKLADYGVINGSACSINIEDGLYYFWSKNGLCRCLPFENISSEYVVPFEKESEINSTFLVDKNNIKFISSILVNE